MLRKLICLAVLLFALPALSQTSTPPSNSPQARAPRQEPCWQVAGIEKSAIEQRWALERETQSQVQAVCANSSLTPQQKKQQVHEIREQAHQKMEGIITPEQQQALTACQQQRSGNHPAPHPGPGGLPCGEMPPHPANPNPSGESGNPPPPSSSPQN